MKGFNFKLENILKVKSLREDLAKAELAHLQSEYRKEEDVLQELQNSYNSYQNQLQQKQQSPMTVQEFRLYSCYFYKVSQDITKQESSLAILEEQVNKQRDKLVESVKERKILENLKQKKYQEFQKIILSREQNFLDEIATNNFIRPKG